MWFLCLLGIPTLVLIFLLWCYFTWNNSDLMSLAVKLPTPVPKKLLLGTYYCPSDNALIFNTETFARYIIETLRLAAREEFSVYCNWIGPKPYICVQKPSDIQVILNNSKAIDKNLKPAKHMFGDGLLSASGARWKKSRRQISPLFQNNNLQSLLPLFNKYSAQLIMSLNKHVDCGLFDILGPAMETAVTSVCALIFGRDTVHEMDRQTIEGALKFIKKGTSLFRERTLKPWMGSGLTFNLFYKKKLEKMSDCWEQFVTPILQVLECKKHSSSGKKNIGTEKRCDKIPTNILDALPDMYGEDLHFEMKTLLLTGSETVAVTFSSCLFILGHQNHQDIQDALYQEIVSVVGSEPADVSVTNLNDLPYLERVIKETMRVTMIVPLINRVPSEDIQLRSCTLPKGEKVVLSIIGLHFDPEVYPDPHVFDPDRFTPDKIVKRHPYSFLPFAGGPRNCIGKQYAFMLLKILLVHFLKAYKVRSKGTLEDLSYNYSISINSKHGYVIELLRRR